MKPLIILSTIVIAACIAEKVGSQATPSASATQPAATQPGNTPNADATSIAFDPSTSDAKAIELADLVLEAVGGQEAWDNTRYITWNFFGRRRLTWDRQTGDLRIESGERTPDNDIGAVVLMNLNTRQGRAWGGGQEILDEAQLVSTVKASRSVWENDAYWLCMPFKLKDGGVTLKYRGEGTTKDGREADIIRLTFKNVGETPWTMYDLWITRDDHLIGQWAYYPNSGDQDPEFTQPWSDWQRHGKILLSADRGERMGTPARITDIAVFETMPESVFRNPAAVDWSTMIDQSRPHSK
jgi:hypothetical protein